MSPGEDYLVIKFLCDGSKIWELRGCAAGR